MSYRHRRQPHSSPTRWNHNIHYYDLVLDAVPSTARTALDVGTGDGLLAERLATEVPEVTAIDSDADVMAGARALHADGIIPITGDVLTHRLPRDHYDIVAAVATVHHFPTLEDGLARLADLTAPGGTLAVIGCARSSTVLDLTMDLLGVAQHQLYSRTRGHWQHNAPVKMSLPHTYSETRSIAEAVLPTMGWRRLPLWRYYILWQKPLRSSPQRSASPHR